MPAAPVLLPGYKLRMAYWAARREARRTLPGHPLTTPFNVNGKRRRGLLIHSGAKGIGTAEWAWRVANLEKKDFAALFWAHLAFSGVEECYFQTDYLNSWAPHGGGLNRFAYGIETPHHPGCDPVLYRDKTVAAVGAFVEHAGVEWITCHRFIDPKNKFDPSPCVTADWFVHLPVRIYWDEITIQDILETEGLD